MTISKPVQHLIDTKTRQFSKTIYKGLPELGLIVVSPDELQALFQEGYRYGYGAASPPRPKAAP